MEIDPKTGLPIQAMGWEDLAKSSQRIKVTTDRKRYGKIVTVVDGFDRGIDLKATAKALKNELACGGTFDKEAGMVELQGEHVQRVTPILVKLGFDAESIEVD